MGRPLTQLSLDTKWPPFCQTTISNAFSWMKWYNYDSTFTEICSHESNWQQSSICLDNGLALNRQDPIIWTNADPVHWPIYTTLGGDELTHCPSDEYIYIYLYIYANLFSIGPLRTNFGEIWINNTSIFIPENDFENVVCKMAAICLCLDMLPAWQWKTVTIVKSM